MFKNRIGILAEKKPGESRIALPPRFIKTINNNADYHLTVEPSDTRSFTNDEFIEHNIIIDSIPEDANVILAVKEIPIQRIEADKTYMYFSHTIKGQDYNMNMLQHVLDVKATLIDYEVIRDAQGRRLVFFGRYAGIAGMINSLWTYGKKLQIDGINNPFLKIKQARDYRDFDEAIVSLKSLKAEIHSFANKQNAPLIIGIAGYGNVSKGAQEVLDLLDPQVITPAKLLTNKKPGLYKVVFKEQDSVQTIEEAASFELQDYYENPEKYKPAFSQYLPYISVLVNCIYWTAKYPRLIYKKDIDKLFKQKNIGLKTIGDISCDIVGGIEITTKATISNDPIYTYNPETGQAEDGLTQNGIAMMTVDNLPAELPREASMGFGEKLLPLMESLFTCDFSNDFNSLVLTPELKCAVIAHKGKLTPEFSYLTSYLENK
jgi:alanine dehydrogenase